MSAPRLTRRLATRSLVNTLSIGCDGDDDLRSVDVARDGGQNVARERRKGRYGLLPKDLRRVAPRGRLMAHGDRDPV